MGGVNERERQLLRQRFIHTQFTIIIHHKQFPVGIIQLEEPFEAASQGLGALIPRMITLNFIAQAPQRITCDSFDPGDLFRRKRLFVFAQTASPNKV